MRTRASREGRPRATIAGVLALALAVAVLVPFLPLSYFTWVGYQDDVARIEREIQETNHQIARLGSNYLESLLAGLRQEALSAAAAGAAPRAQAAVHWELVSASGRVVSTQLDPGRVGRDAGYDFAPAEHGQVTVSGVQRWIPGRAPTALIGARFALDELAPGPEHAALRPQHLVGVLDPDSLSREMTAWSGELLDRHVYVVDEAGRLLFYSDPEISRRGVDLSSNPPIRMYLDGGQGPLRFESVVSHKPRLGYVARLATAPWGVIVSADIGTRLIALRDRYLVIAWTIGFALVAVMSILVWTSRRLTLPVRQIHDALRAERGPARGPLSVPSAVRGIAEYHGLVEAYDELARRFATTERELVQAERAALLGQLASGIAHEIGTPLNVMSGNAQYLLKKLAPDDAARGPLQQVVAQTERISAMVRRLLDFARPAEARRARVDWRDVVPQTIEMVSPMLRRIRLETDLDPDTPSVLGDPRLLEHVLLNLLVNAVQAMPDGGRLAVVTGLGRVPARGAAEGDEDWVCCRVVDSGCGIAASHLGRVFEPFFTTKPQGQGTGLGLAIVDRIVKQHGGQVDVASRPGRGSTFTIRLKPAPRAAASDSLAAPARPGGSAAHE